MAIYVSLPYNGGLLPDIILLTQCYYHRGNLLNAMKRFCLLRFFPLTEGCSEGLDAFRFFVQKFGLRVPDYSNMVREG